MNAVWYYYWAYLGVRKRGKPLGKYKWAVLSLFEHYHWATILAILGFRLNIPLLTGISSAFLIDEGVGQQHKFSMGSGHFRESMLIESLIILIWILVELLSLLAYRVH